MDQVCLNLNIQHKFLVSELFDSLDEASRDDSDDEFARTAKKQRLSSPTYDEQFELSQDVVAAFDDFERKLSQAPPSIPFSQPRSSQANTESARKRRRSQIALALGQVLTESDGLKGTQDICVILCL